jgi:hypothetical protein
MGARADVGRDQGIAANRFGSVVVMAAKKQLAKNYPKQLLLQDGRNPWGDLGDADLWQLRTDWYFRRARRAGD